MKTTVYFTKYFTKGILKGLTYNDKISHPTVEGCANYIKVITAKGKAGKLPYIVIDSSFQNYAR
jgi:hypothetical protein